jgi:hypothetical protein
MSAFAVVLRFTRYFSRARSKVPVTTAMKRLDSSHVHIEMIVKMIDQVIATAGSWRNVCPESIVQILRQRT